jgi:hypothetical protein
MITGVHTMFYSSEPERLRAFLRDKLRFPATDVGEGWLIFDMPDAEMGCHPAEDMEGQRSGTHYISFYCDDIKETVAELKGRGVEFTGEIQDVGYGLATQFRVPGGFEVQLYQPRYTRNAKPAATKARRGEAGRKAARTRKRSSAGVKAAATRKRRQAGRKAAASRAAKRSR